MSGYLTRFIGTDRLPKNLSSFDLDMYFRLPADMLAAIKDRFRADHLPGVENRMIALATQVVFLRTTGRSMDSASLVPPALLRSLGAALDVPAPRIASLRSIYKRHRTLYDHQQWARQLLQVGMPSKAVMAELSQVLATQAGHVPSIDELVTAAYQWLYARKVVIPADRTLRDLARAAFSDTEKEAIRIVKAALSNARWQACCQAVFAPRPSSGQSTLEWLKTPPKRHSPSTLGETLEKVRFLRGLEVHVWDLQAIPLARQRAYGQAMAARPPSITKRKQDDVQRLEIVCFLRMVLLELTDSALFQTGRRVSDLLRQASERTRVRQVRRSGDYRSGLVKIKEHLDDASRTAEERLAAIRDIVTSLGDLSTNSVAAEVREVLVDDPARVDALLRAVGDLPFEGRPNEISLQQLQEVRRLHAEGLKELPPDLHLPVQRVWKKLMESDDRKRAMKALEVSAVLSLRKGLRRGSVWINHSLSFREREQMLIPQSEWARDKAEYLSALNLPAEADTFLAPVLELIQVGLVALAKARQAGAVEIDDKGLIHLPKLVALLDEDNEPLKLRDAIFKDIGSVQLPDLMLEIDARTNVSEVLLGHRPRDEQELLALYAALLSHGTEMDAKSIAAMMPQLDPGHISAAMRQVEADGRMHRANRRLVEFLRKHAIAAAWGTGGTGSSDMMSLDASRHLFNARIDPRRRTYAIGMYTHVLDQYGLVYNQPVVLNERQVGPAIEGVVQHNRHVADGTRMAWLAVDTHGYTNVGMAIAKLLGFDLCPGLRQLKERKLYLPRTIDTPEGLGNVVVSNVSMKAIRDGWDELLRVIASIVSGRISAAILLQRLGSAAQGDPLHKAADHLGRLLRTLFLCDYFSNPAFRREHRILLNRGESVHQLQRTIHDGKVAPLRGRRRDELVTISGAHALLTNMVLAWNTHHMQQVIDHWRRTGREIDEIWLARMGPAHSGHINFRGLFQFGIAKYREQILGPRQVRRHVA